MPDESKQIENTQTTDNSTESLTPRTINETVANSSTDNSNNVISDENNITTTKETPTLEVPKDTNNQLLAIPQTAVVQKKSKINLLATFAVLVLIGLAVGAWFVMGQSSTNTKTTQSAKQIVEIPSLTIGITEGPANTYFPDESLVGVYTVLNRQIYEGLVGFENSKISPLLAESWTNPDQNTWVFKLRPNAIFHTGKAVTAKEVEASLNDLKQYDYWSLFVSTISSIEATGDLELTIRTAEPDALLLNRLTQAYIVDTNAQDLVGMNGTGAYVKDESAENNEKISTLKAFDNYYGGRAKTRKIIFKIFETEAELPLALKNKQIDILETLTFPELSKDLTAAGFDMKEYESPGVFGMYPNLTRSKSTPLLDKNFRLAIAHALDRQALVDTLGNKNSPAYQIIPKSLPGHDSSITAPAYDVEAAKSTLAKTKYANTPLEFVYIKELQTDAPIIIEQLRKAGFNIKEKSYSSANIDAVLSELNAGRYDLFLAAFTSDVSDARDLLGSLLHSKESTYGNYNDPVYDELLTATDKEFDPVKRIQLLQQANNYVADNLVWFPLRNGVYNSYHNKDIDLHADYTGGSGLGVYYRNVGRIVE